MGENFMFGNYNYGGGNGVIDPSMMNYNYQYGYQPVVPQPIPYPQNNNAATDEEISQMLNAKPKDVLNINIDPIQNLRSICCHKHKHVDKVIPINDGSGDVYCPICQARWSPDQVTEEDLEVCVNTIKNCMQNDKWVGDLPVEFVRQYYSILPFIEMYPKIHSYSMKNFDKLVNARGYNNAQNVSSNVLFNNIMTPDYNYYQQMPMGGMNNNPYNQFGMNQQPMNQYSGYPQQNPYVNAAYPQQPMGQMATGVNPMQIPYGFNQQAPNQQFVNQANMMMGQQQVNPNPYAPNPTNAVTQQTTPAPIQPEQPQATQQQQQQTETKKYDL